MSLMHPNFICLALLWMGGRSNWWAAEGRSGQRKCKHSSTSQCVQCECVRALAFQNLGWSKHHTSNMAGCQNRLDAFFFVSCFSVCIFLPCSPMDAYAWWAAEGRPEHCIIGGRPKAALHKKYKYSVYACLSMDTVCMLSALLFYGCRCLVGGRRPP